MTIGELQDSLFVVISLSADLLSQAGIEDRAAVRERVIMIAKALPELVSVLNCVSEDAQMALAGAWDKSDSGFEAMRDRADSALRLLELEPPIYDNPDYPAQESFE